MQTIQEEVDEGDEGVDDGWIRRKGKGKRDERSLFSRAMAPLNGSCDLGDELRKERNPDRFISKG